MKRRAAALMVATLMAFGGAAQAIDFTNFHTPAQIDSELANLATSHPTIAQRVSLGNSVEGQPIWGLKISDNVGTNEPAEGEVVILALHHAREWIAAETGLFIAEYLVNHFTDADLNTCLANLEVWVVPVVNPDGYQFSTSPGNRLWRKNRSNNGDGTWGVDLNRNYAYQWGLGGGGSEGDPGSHEDTYWGLGPFSEPETQVVRNFIQGLDHPRALLSYHSFSELFLRPWSHTSADPPGEPSLAFLAKDSIQRIATVHSHTYAETISYHAFGEATDYFWQEMRLAGFTPELRPANFGQGDAGFTPPASEILPAAQENLPAVLALIRDAGCRRLWIKDHDADTGSEPSAEWLGDHWSAAFWTSPDIWTEPAELTEGATVTLKVRVHNDGAVANNATVRAYYTDPGVALEFPNPANTLIGQQTLNLPSGDTVVNFSWTVPTGTNVWGERHWCVGAIVSHPEDRPLTTLIERTNNLGGKNFHPQPALSSLLTGVTLTNFLAVEAEARLVIDPATLPPGWRVELTPLPARPLSRKARILGLATSGLAPGESLLQPIRIVPPPGADPAQVHQINISGALVPLVAGERKPVGNGFTFAVRAPPP